MAARTIALAFAAIVSAFSLMATLDSATAQEKKSTFSCSRFCDCNFECIDFCGAGRCPCPRLLRMKAACERACKTCNRNKLDRKKVSLNLAPQLSLAIRQPRT